MNMTDKLDRATFQHRWTDDLAAAHTEARDKWAKAAAESAGELRAFADFLHELDVPELVAMADDLAGERLSETAEWPAWAELDEREPDGVIVVNVPLTPKKAEDIRRRFAERGKQLIIDAPNVIHLPAEPDLEMGREIRAALSRPALIRGTYIPDKPAETADEYMEQDDVDDEPWHRRTWAATKRAVLRLDAWAERIGEDK